MTLGPNCRFKNHKLIRCPDCFIEFCTDCGYKKDVLIDLVSGNA